jgi:predicted nucleic acid-binding protein
LLEERRPHVKYVTPSYLWDAITDDRDDNKFVDAAVAGGAELIVTNDRHFNVLHGETRIHVLPIDPKRFIADYC